MTKTLVVILGPTGVGKTDTCIKVAKHFNVPIINADSRQIFQELPLCLLIQKVFFGLINFL